MTAREGLLRYLPAAAFVPALLLPFATLRVFASGVSERAEPIIVGAHACAALAAFAIALHLLAGRRLPRVALWSALPAAIMAVWSFAVALVRGTPMIGLFGVPQSGLGVLWFIDLALWLLLAGLAVQSATGWRRLTDLCAAACLAFALLTLWGRYTISEQPSPDLPLLYISTAWPVLTLPVMLLAHPGGRFWALRIGAVLVASALLLFATGSAAFATVAVGWAICFGIHWRWGHRLPWLQSRALALLAVLFVLVLPFIMVVSEFGSRIGLSMRSRVLTGQVVMARLQDQWDAGLFGLGWGRTGETFAMYLDVVKVSLWDIEGWDFLLRDFFHSHNLLIESALGAGLPGVMLAVAIPAIPIWLAPPAKRIYAAAFACGWLLLLGVWFELIFVLPLFALAVAALCHNDDAIETVRQKQRLSGATSAAFAVVAGLLCVAAGLLVFQMAGVDRMRAWLDAPQGPAPQFIDPVGDDRILAALANKVLGDMGQRIEERRLVPEEESRRVIWAIAALDARMPGTTNPALPIIGTNILAELALNPQLASVLTDRSKVLSRWPLWLDRALVLAPARIDVPVGYLSWRFAAGDESEVLLWTRRLRNRNPDDPVGLYYEGGVYALQSDPQTRQRGIMLLRRSLDHGVDRYIPLDDAFKAQIRAAAG